MTKSEGRSDRPNKECVNRMSDIMSETDKNQEMMPNKDQGRISVFTIFEIFILSIGVMMSKDGIEWSDPVWVPKCEGMDENGTRFYEPHGIQLPSGKILVHIRAEGAPYRFSIYQSESVDGGKTFSVPVCVNPCGSPPHLMLHSSGALICVYGYRSEPYGQRAMISWDEGATWERDIVLRDDGPSGDLGYPASVELKNGHILTVYYQKPTSDSPSSIYSTEWSLEK